MLVLLLSCCTPPSDRRASDALQPATIDSVLAKPSASGEPRPISLPANAAPAAGQPVIVRASGPGEPGPASAAPAAAGAGDITLNFAGADIHDVIASVLGETLKLNYVIDADVTGSVSFNVSRPLRREEVMSALEAVLNSRGATMVQADGIIRVMALRADGKPRAATPLLRGPGGAIGEHIEIFPVRFVGVADVQHVLEKVMPPGQVIVGVPEHRMLLVEGSPDELRLAEDTVRTFDVDQMSGMSVALLPLQHADAATLVVELQNIFEASRKDADANIIRFIPVARLNAVMILSRQPRYFDEARAWVARLDRTQNLNEQKLYVYNLHYGKAASIAEILQGALTGMDVQVKTPTSAPVDALGTPIADMNQPTRGSAVSTAASPAAVPPSSPAAVPAPAAAPPPAGAMTTVHIEADDAHNALLITASPRDYGLIRQVLESIDTPPLQVLIEVTVAEVVLNNNLRYGVQYFINSRGGANNNVQSLLSTGSTLAGIAPTLPGAALSLTAANFQPKIILDALSELTQTKVISTPRLLVLDNQTARLQVGDVVPIITQSAASAITSNPLVLSNVQYKETGVVLEVTPRVNPGGVVTLDVNQAVSDVVQTTTSTINSPTIRQRRLTSTISVKSGNSILLGGLIQDQDNRDSSGIPLLHEIPVIGALFGNRNDTSARTELIMLLTPRVLANEQEATDVTDVVRRQFQAVLDRANIPPVRTPSR
jgi:general secretion pathway protein D